MASFTPPDSDSFIHTWDPIRMVGCCRLEPILNARGSGALESKIR